MPMLNLETVGFKYSETWVLNDVSFQAQEGELIGIIGPNGSGKTTLLKVVNGLLAPQQGSVCVNGMDVRKMNKNALARLMAVVPQNSPMIFPFSVEEIVLMGRYPYLRNFQFEGKADIQIAHNAMELTDTLALRARNINELSGGERQMVLIARALASEPRIMLLDEPAAFLDIRHQITFFDLIKDLTRRQSMTVIAVTHDINLASLYCDKIVLLNAGSIHTMGTPDEVITEAIIEEVYQARVSVTTHPVTCVPQVMLTGSAALPVNKEQRDMN
jgi:iron complex transport system ATP-binding protein